jgi:hypothetical protein
MAKDVGRYGFASQLWHVCGCRGDGPLYDVRRSEAGETGPVRTDKKRATMMLINTTFSHQSLQCFDEVMGNRHYPFLPSLTAQQHLRPRLPQLEIAGIDAERLGNAGAGSCHKQQQRSISTTELRSLVWRSYQGIQFATRQMMGDLCVRLLDWNGQDSLRDAERSRVVRGDMMKE